MSKREDILLAATPLFSRQGVRKTSMDEIAASAGVAKPTIYAYFENKKALYAAVCGHVGEQMLADARLAAASGGDVAARLTGVLSSKFTRTWLLVDTSPFAHELLQTQDAGARHAVEAATDALKALLIGVIDGAQADGALDLAQMGLSAQTLADQLFRVGHGAGYGATSVEEQQRNLAALVATMLRAGRQPGG